MSGRRRTLAAAVAAACAVAGGAHAQCGDILWCDGFEHYARGASPIGQDCARPSECDPAGCDPDCCPEGLSWESFWENPRAADALVAPDPVQDDNALCVDAPDPPNGIVDDMVHTFHDLAIDPSASFDFEIDVFVPQAYVEGPDADVWVILLNRFDPPGANNWSTQIHFNSASQTVISDFDGGAVPFATDAWGTLRVSVDLVANTQRILWNDDLIVEKSWTEGVSGGGIRDLQALDVFAGDTTVPLYFDDARVTARPGGGACAPSLCLGDLDRSGAVDFDDLLRLLNAWGPGDDECPPHRPADLDLDCVVDFDDLLILLSAWGPC